MNNDERIAISETEIKDIKQDLERLFGRTTEIKKQMFESKGSFSERLTKLEEIHKLCDLSKVKKQINFLIILVILLTVSILGKDVNLSKIISLIF